MGERKVILLPDDTRILDLFKGNSGAEKEDIETEIPEAPTRKRRRSELL